MSNVGRLAVFVAVIGLVVAGAATVGFMTSDRPAEANAETVDSEYYTDEELLSDAELAARSGEIELEDGPSRTVAIATDGSPGELDPIVTALVDAGHEVRIVGGSSGALPPGLAIAGVRPAPTSGDETDLRQTLDDADAFLIVGNTQFNDDEREAIETFVENDGRFVVATDDASADADLVSLTSSFGVTVGNGYLYNMHDNDANYQRVYGSGTDSLSAADRLVFDRVSPVSGTGTTVARVAGEETHYSETREPGSFDVAMQRDSVMLIGDSNLYSSLNYNRGDNEQLVERSLEFLTGGPTDPYTAESSEESAPSRPPEAPTPGESSGEESAAPPTG